jgi:hypothetical protein
MYPSPYIPLVIPVGALPAGEILSPVQALTSALESRVEERRGE